ncbi:MAG: SGNH/GDSL hydrolase family protein [Paludibacteraceae bacterium]
MNVRLKNTRFLFTGLLIGLLLLGCSGTKSLSVKNSAWVGTWSTAPQLVEPHNMPPEPGLTNNTIRQIIRVSVGGEEIRLRFSNVFSKSPVEMKMVTIAEATEGSAINMATQKQLQFNKKSNVTMTPGGEVFSDPLKFNFKPGSLVAITIYFEQTSPDVTGHPGSRTTSFILSGNNIASADFSGSVKTDHWYVIQSMDIKASKNSKAVAVLGNSITDGRGSGTNKQNRWPDILSARLLANEATKNIGVLNLGIGGNCVVRGGLGPTALERFDRDILSQSNVRWLIILEGINDIGGIKSQTDAEKVSSELIQAYQQMIDKAHAKGILVYGATILPFAKSFYDTPERQAARDKVNEWIRNSGRFDAVIDFDKIMRNPYNVITILPDMHDGDFLHPNEAGYKRMGEGVDLKLFSPDL